MRKEGRVCMLAPILRGTSQVSLATSRSMRRLNAILSRLVIPAQKFRTFGGMLSGRENPRLVRELIETTVPKDMQEEILNMYNEKAAPSHRRPSHKRC